MKIPLQVLFVLIFAPILCAAKGFVSGPHYYYPIVLDADGWNYQTSDCAVLADADFKKLKRLCKVATDHSKRCPTEKTVTLKNIAPQSPKPVGSPGEKAMADAQKVDETTKTFRLDYMVFISEKQCIEDRAASLKK